jgi:DNA-binding transcriptional LysR family regulator
MEMNEIRYFLAVAKTENMNKASQEIGVSAGSLSKAISRLEDELQVKLFSRIGRNIQLTDYGRFLKKKGHALLDFEESIKTEILGKDSSFQVVIGGSEILLSSFGVQFAKELKKMYPLISFQFEVVKRRELKARVRDGEIDLGITTYDIPKEWDQKILSSISFFAFISKKHSLFKQVKKGSVSIDEVLKHAFVVPREDILGKISKSDSVDGWRDDKLPRKIIYSSTSLKTIESLVLEGEAIAYLPDFYGNQSDLIKLKIIGCPYYCKQKVRLFTKDKSRSGWINQLF